jgi:hypothetical protein
VARSEHVDKKAYHPSQSNADGSAADHSDGGADTHAVIDQECSAHTQQTARDASEQTYLHDFSSRLLYRARGIGSG